MAKKPSPDSRRRQSVVAFAVVEGLEISPIPTRFTAGQHELVLWMVGNTLNTAVTVRLEKFHLDDDDTAKELDPSPIIWLVERTVTVGPKGTGFIVGLRNPAYIVKPLHVDRVKYTIHVEADGNAMDHDPDGDIKP